MTSGRSSQSRVRSSSSSLVSIALTHLDASYYYLRNALHDHPDVACITLLQNTKSAMSPKSTIFIDEKVLPNVGAPLKTVQLDISMMASLAGRERSEGDWKKIVEAAELKIAELVTYD